MNRHGVYLRWSWRDLRARWIQVAAIACIVALGTGMYASLTSITKWRRVSQPASYAKTNMFDLRVELASGSYRPVAQLESVTRSASADVADAQARLLESTQIDASVGRTVLVPGRIVGIPLNPAGPPIAAPARTSGRALTAADAGADTAILDENFLRFYRLHPPFAITISGGTPLRVVGGALAPEYFYLTGDQGNLLGVGNFAVLFTSIETAQRLAGRPGLANDVVVSTRPGSNPDVVAEQLRARFARDLPDVGITVTTKTQDPTYAILQNDIATDQRFYVVFSLVVLLGAAFAAFNLAGRIVESQRREIGIGLALGEGPQRLAIRPLLVGTQIAALGALLGIALGALFTTLLSHWLAGIFLLPEWRFPMDWWAFARAAALGLVLPIIATLWPVWRAFRVEPVDAIHTGPENGHAGGLAPLVARIPLPGTRTITQLPFRNVVRAPRRTLMTAFGIAAAIVVLVSVIGMLDSFYATIDRAEAELTRTQPDRLTVQLDGFALENGPVVSTIRNATTVADAEPHLSVGGQALGRTTIDILIELLPPDSTIWAPTVRDVHQSASPGIVLTTKAAHDLGVRPGERIRLRLPQRQGLASFSYVDQLVPVIGVNPIPTRFIAFMPPNAAGLMNLDGIVNSVTVTPKPGLPASAVQRELFGKAGIASVQPISAFTQAIRTEMNQSVGFLNVLRTAVLILALLIAFNTASINTDERARDHATMFAFGMRLRTLLRINTIEGLLLGLLGTALGLACGWLLLTWMLRSVVAPTIPDIAVTIRISPTTAFTALALGIAAVAIAPLLTIRKLRRMDVPATLRVVE